MKRLLYTIMVLIIAAGLAAAAPLTAREKVNACQELGKIAYRIMYVRQNGVPRSKAIDVLVDGEDNDMDDIILRMIVAAWHEPVHEEDETKIKVSLEFKRLFENSCYDAAISD